jgi:hypothetical protein
MTTDPGLIWLKDEFAFDDRPWPEPRGTIARGWKKWYVGAGQAEWGRAFDCGLVQEVSKTAVTLGIYRQNQGFAVDKRYRISFQVKLISATGGTPSAAVGIHPLGENDFVADGNLDQRFSEIEFGPWVPLTAPNGWLEVAHEFNARNRTQTILLAVDFQGQQGGLAVHDGIAHLADVEIRCGTGNSGVSLPWMADGSPPVEPPYIYGIHDARGVEIFDLYTRRYPVQPQKGWVVHALAIGADPNDGSGQRFSEWVAGQGVIVRLSYAFGDDIPPSPGQYDDFAARCANFVKASLGAGIWSIGNETPIESGATAAQYALCYCRCRDAIKRIRPGAQVITGGMMHGNADYLSGVVGEIQRLRGEQKCGLGGDDLGIDGFAIHSYTNSNSWNASSFEEYRTLMARIPAEMRHLPVYMTEAGSGSTGTEYPESNTGFVDLMFRNVHAWNQAPGTQKIRSVNLYRWDWQAGSPDHWGIEHKPGMIEDFLSAMQAGYKWR